MSKVLAYLSRPGARRWFRRGALAWAGWLALSTLLLNQPLMERWINRNPVKFHIGWDFALAPVPGYVMAWGVDARGQSSGIAFGAHARHASGWLVPWSLAGRTIDLWRARATGLAVHVRQGQVTLPRPTPREKPWTVRVRGAAFRELWSLNVGTAAGVAGRGSGRVGLRKVLSGGELEITGAQLDWQDLKAWAGGLEVVQGGRAGATLALAPLPARSSGLRALRALSLQLDLDAALVPLSLDRSGLRLASRPSQAGRLTANLALVDGILRDESRVALAQPLHLDVDGLVDDRTLGLELAVKDRKLALDATLPEGSKPGSSLAAHLTLPLPRPEDLRAARDDQAPHALSRHLLGQTSGIVDLNLRFRSLALLKPWLARWRGLEATGDGWMHATMTVQNGHLAEGSRVEFQDVALSASAMDHRLEARVDGPLVPVDKGSGRHRLELDDVKLFGPNNLLLLEDADAQLDLVPHGQDQEVLLVPGLALQVREAGIPDIAVFNVYLPPDTVVLGKGKATLNLAVDLDAEEASANATLGLHAPAVTARMADMRLGGSLQLDAALRDVDFDTRTLDLVGSRLGLRNVSFQGSDGRTVSGWSMDASVDEAHATIAAPLRIQGSGKVAMSDLRLLLNVYSQISDYPMWMLRIADAGQVTAQARFELDEGRFRLLGVHARNERFEVDARLELARNQQRGAMLASWGPMALAVDLQPGGSQMHIRNARDWYRQKAP